MAILDEELIRDANEDAEAIRHIRAQMPSSMSALCTDADLQQIIDATVDTLATSDILESQTDADGFIDINLDILAQQVAKEVGQTGINGLSTDDIQFIVETWMDLTRAKMKTETPKKINNSGTFKRRTTFPAFECTANCINGDSK